MFIQFRSHLLVYAVSVFRLRDYANYRVSITSYCAIKTKLNDCKIKNNLEKLAHKMSVVNIPNVMFMRQETGRHFFVYKIAEPYHLHLPPILGVNQERNMRPGKHDAYLPVIG